MSKRDSLTGSTAVSERAARRGKPVKVSKPFPWGSVAGGSVLALVLVGILGYAFVNQGSGYVDPVTAADESVEGVQVIDTTDVDTAHVEGPVDYGSDQPPAVGQMASATVPCGTAFPTQPATEQVMHTLEHGAVWITYRPDLPEEQVEELTRRARGLVIVSPWEGLDSPVSVQAWARKLTVESVDDPRIDTFIDAYQRGAQAPEGSVGC